MEMTRHVFALLDRNRVGGNSAVQAGHNLLYAGDAGLAPIAGDVGLLQRAKKGYATLELGSG